MTKMKFLSKTSVKKLSGVALLRLDFNTQDDWRLKAALPTIQFLLKYAKAIVILSHKGRPMGFQREFSLKSDAQHLGEFLKRPVNFFDEFNLIHIRKEAESAPPGSIFVLENLRFMPGEAKNDREFASNLALLGDYFVNEAFAVSHRENASVCAITEFLPSYAGLGLESEIVNLSKVMGAAKRPLLMIIGGAKMEDKLGVIKFFKSKADLFLVGGALANTLLKLRGVDIGSSLYEKSVSKDVAELAKNMKINLPTDYRIDNGAILDIGPKTEKKYEEEIAKARTIVWNGPMGMIEKEGFAHGTNAVARALAANIRAFTLVGGGETVMAVKKLKIDDRLSFISTGGGAMLDYLAGLKLPGLVALDRKRKANRE